MKQITSISLQYIQRVLLLLHIPWPETKLSIWYEFSKFKFLFLNKSVLKLLRLFKLFKLLNEGINIQVNNNNKIIPVIKLKYPINNIIINDNDKIMGFFIKFTNIN